ncbi:porin [Methylobacterium sp. 88A]|uniref:porin n=1 Tax=Methylobacterium sp. 88A TaxID=1131813 RepID=UPI000372AAE2|nr:porin [Methylobacterium sp. 88A]
MKLLKSSLLGTAAAFASVAGAHAADLPVKKAVPIEYVRVCSAYGAGFFYIPGTDTCIRLSGRARLDIGYQPTDSRSGSNGDTTGYIGLARINVDARTQTAYGTLRAFTRIQFASRTSATGGLRSGTQERIGSAFGATGQDQFGRAQQFVNTDKAFIQFAGLTAGRASSFFDFYAHDFEFAGATLNSDVQSTNLLAYSAKFGEGFSATISLEDPTFRRNTIYSQNYASGTATAPSPVFLGNALVTPAGALFGTVQPIYGNLDVAQRNRMPDFVGVLRYDAAWGSAQISAAVKEINAGNFVSGSYLVNGGTPAATTVIAGASALTGARPANEYGWAVQGGVKINTPFIAPGDTLYLQGAYGEGATLYTGYSSYNGSYASFASTINGAAFDPYMSDATLNPATGKIETSTSFTVVGSFLHYWSPEWRSAVFGSYGEMSFARGAREANAVAFQTVSSTAQFTGRPGVAGDPSFSVSPVLRDTYQIVAGASLIWSPVKDLDIGVEGFYTKVGVQNGRVVDRTQSSGNVNAASIASGAVRTVTADDTYQVRMRVQRDF